MFHRVGVNGYYSYIHNWLYKRGILSFSFAYKSPITRLNWMEYNFMGLLALIALIALGKVSDSVCNHHANQYELKMKNKYGIKYSCGRVIK